MRNLQVLFWHFQHVVISPLKEKFTPKKISHETGHLFNIEQQCRDTQIMDWLAYMSMSAHYQ